MNKYVICAVAICAVGWFAAITTRSPNDRLPPELRKIAAEVEADWDGPHGQQVRDACAAGLGLSKAPKYDVDYIHISQDTEKLYRDCLMRTMYPVRPSAQAK
jgi:hypothetical protein